jgi:streptogramin lyase
MKKFLMNWRALAGAIALTACALHAATPPPPQVKTLGGGPNQLNSSRRGKADGDMLNVAKFNAPSAVAIDSDGNLFVADRRNGSIRKVSKPGTAGSLTTTFVSRLAQPTGVWVDSSNRVHVVTYGDGRLRVYSKNGVLLNTVFGLTRPTALVLDDAGNAYVTEYAGRVKQVTPDGSINLLAAGFSRPSGIAICYDGRLAIAESGRHAIYALDPNSGEVELLAGNNGPGYADGAGSEARFYSPCGLATAPNGSLLVADRLNHRVRVITTNGEVRTLYGVSRQEWSRTFAGWVDGPGGDEGIAAGREPLGVTVADSGIVYATEGYWNLVRQVTQSGLDVTNSSGGTTVTNGTNVTVTLPAPRFYPVYGYYPFGVTVTVTSTAPVYYTVDGSEPNTNSLRVVMDGGVGSITFGESLRDLRSLRFKAISDIGTSPTVSGQAPPRNEIGIPTDLVAGSGARAFMVPVVANLIPDARIQSYQYRVEITPLNGAPPVLPWLDAASIDTNDFVQLVTPAQPGKVAHFTVSRYVSPLNSAARGLVITASGTNANVDFKDFAATALLRIPFDRTAIEGHEYSIQVLYPSATSNNYQGDITLHAGPARTIRIGSRGWIVGDLAPGFGYNGGDFGNGRLVNSDANSVLFAAVGLRRPFDATDAYNAMDAFPPEPDGSPEGDGFIDYNDWQVVLGRSLALDIQNWIRRWVDGGFLESQPTELAPAQPRRAAVAKSGSTTPGAIWMRDATLSVANVQDTGNGGCSVPVSIKVAPGASIAGMCFRVIVESVGGSAAPQNVTFEPYIGAQAFMILPGGAPNDVVAAWTMVPNAPFQLTGNSVIGRVRFNVPSHAGPGTQYRIRIVNASGAQNSDVAASFESIPGTVWPFGQSPIPAERTSDEWRAHFFGVTNSPSANQFEDPDADGVPNWQEYLDGTHPVNPDSYLHLNETLVNGAMHLSWLSAPGKLYIVERGASASGPWKSLASNITGDGESKEVIDFAPTSAAPFYRVRVQN